MRAWLPSTVVDGVAVAALRRFHALLQGCHQVDDLGARLRGRGLLDHILALVLCRDAIAELLGERVVVAAGIPVRAHRVEELGGDPQVAGIGLGASRQVVDLRAGHDLVGEAHRRHRQHTVEWPDGGEVLLVAHDHRADPDEALVLHRRQQQLVGLLGRVVGRHQPVGALVVDRVDVGEGDEVAQLDRPGRLRLQFGELVLVERDVATLADVEPELDVVGVDLLAGPFGHLLVADPRAGALLQLVEVHVVVADGGVAPSPGR